MLPLAENQSRDIGFIPRPFYCLSAMYISSQLCTRSENSLKSLTYLARATYRANIYKQHVSPIPHQSLPCSLD
jgi:hypothetical protein